MFVAGGVASPDGSEAAVSDGRGQEEGDGGGEQSRDGIGVAAADGVLFELDLCRDVVEPASECIDVAAKLLALVQVEVERELHFTVAFQLIELRHDRDPQVGQHSSDRLSVPGCSIGEGPGQAVGPFPAAGFDGVVERTGDAVPEIDQLTLYRGASLVGGGGGE